LKSETPIFVPAKILDEQGRTLAQKNDLGERSGIRVQELTPSLAFHFNFKGQKDVLVSEVVSGSASEVSGIKAGDIITKVNLKEVRGVKEFEEAFDEVKKGSSLHILLFRDERFQEVNLFLEP
jgi:serine protease Do